MQRASINKVYSDFRESLSEHVIKQHTVISDTHSISLIKKPGRSEFWAEIICGVAGTVIVHGDFDMCGFRGWYKDSWRQVLSWVASSHIDYLVAKASHLTDEVYTHEFCRQTAEEDLERYLEEELIDFDTCSKAKSLLYEPDKAREFIYNATADAELYFGEVAASRVVFAHVAIQKLVELLKLDGKLV
jgi:hypothetical protein